MNMFCLSFVQSIEQGSPISGLWVILFGLVCHVIVISFYSLYSLSSTEERNKGGKTLPEHRRMPEHERDGEYYFLGKGSSVSI